MVNNVYFIIICCFILLLLCKNELFSNTATVNIGDKTECIGENENWCRLCEKNKNTVCTNKQCNIKENKYIYTCHKI